MNETAMDTYCYIVLRGKVAVMECDYPFIQTIETALYRSFVGYILTLFECLLVALFWIANLYIERDFTEAFMTSVGLGITLGTGLKIGCHLVDLFIPRDGLIDYAVNVGYSCAAVASQLALLIGMPIFLSMALAMGNKRKQFYGCCTWLPFLLVFAFSFGCSFCYFFVNIFVSRNVLCVMLAPVVLAVLATAGMCGLNALAFTCCSSAQNRMDRLDPVVFDARSRLGWAILYAPLAHLPPAGAIYCFVSLLIQIDITDVKQVFVNEEALRVWNFFFPILILLVTFAVLPSYRDKVMCGCRRQRFVKPVMLAPASHLPSAHPVSSAVPPPLYDPHGYHKMIQQRGSIAPVEKSH